MMIANASARRHGLALTARQILTLARHDISRSLAALQRESNS